jgi:hypothetical protein
MRLLREREEDNLRRQRENDLWIQFLDQFFMNQQNMTKLQMEQQMQMQKQQNDMRVFTLKELAQQHRRKDFDWDLINFYRMLEASNKDFRDSLLDPKRRKKGKRR